MVRNRTMVFRWMAAAFLLLSSGCASDPLPELQPDAFVAPRSSTPWMPDSKADRAIEPGLGMSLPLQRVESMVAAPEGTQSLLHLVDFALSNRPQTRAAWERARVAAAQLGVVRGAWYPTLGITADLSYQKIYFPATGDVFLINQGQFTPTLNLNYLLLDFGRREADDDRARAMLWAANLDFDRIVQQTIHDVQVRYFQLDAALALNEAAERNLELAETILEMVEERMVVGLATKPEMLLARQGLAQARFDLEATVSGISSAKSALLESCGLPASAPIEIARITAEEMPETFNVRVDQVINQSLQNRPDLAAAIARLRATEAAIARAEAEFMPQVSVFGSLGGVLTRFQTTIAESNDPAMNQTFPSVNAMEDVWSVGLSGSWMIFEGFQRENAVRAARAARREAEENLRALRLAAISESWDAFFRVQAAQRQYEFGQALLASSQEAFDAIEAAYVQGLATITELVQSERDLQDARSTLVNTRADLLVATSDLTYAAGNDRGRWVAGTGSESVTSDG